ncbi:casein kinase II regulatory subunit-domain-containing protein [Kickxella alabastrina]|uniref:casein kinase II regulatory subunit-domain-containing protein n=1 Tax=Kickxella alabastrina TaxID=61397 RepID=UPI00221FD1D4|nr:casein kinase II regulatory subunit-domain-containing protein [Kickxella alabastrina]KAI7828421.1 casein kinase II regulatory subunit-domain-containing protein [Kickxella alabastrina]
MAEPAASTHDEPMSSATAKLRPSLQGIEFNSGLDNTEESDFDDEEHYASDDSASMTWITWFCSLKGHEYFCEVPEAFIEDEFNLTGLSQTVNFYVEALDMILDAEDENEDPQYADEIETIDSSAEILYGLIHARYILTRAGQDQMVDKYENSDFGACPRFCCDGTYVVPCGRTDVPERDSVKLFCPSCNDIYSPPSSRYQKVDGAYFGTTFPHMFFQTFPSLVPEDQSALYTPSIYGFAINERSKAGPRMQWLRMLPEKTPQQLPADDDSGDDNDDDAAAGNTTDSQSYVEARDAADFDAHSAPSAPSHPAAGDAQAAAAAPAPADNASADAMDIGTASPCNTRSPSLTGDRRKDYSSSASATAAAVAVA